MESILEALKTFLGSYVVAAMVLLIGICWLVWWIATSIQKMRSQTEKVRDLPCDAHRHSLDKSAAEISETRALLGKMSGELEILVKLATETRPRSLIIAANEYSEKHSPRKLNENGEKLLNDVEGTEFLQNNGAFLKAEIGKLRPKTALDVENCALAVLRANTSHDMFVPIKEWVYNAPSRSLLRRDGSTTVADVSLDDVMFVLSIPLRDLYLREHPEIMGAS